MEPIRVILIQGRFPVRFFVFVASYIRDDMPGIFNFNDVQMLVQIPIIGIVEHTATL